MSKRAKTHETNGPCLVHLLQRYRGPNRVIMEYLDRPGNLLATSKSVSDLLVTATRPVLSIGNGSTIPNEMFDSKDRPNTKCRFWRRLGGHVSIVRFGFQPDFWFHPENSIEDDSNHRNLFSLARLVAELCPNIKLVELRYLGASVVHLDHESWGLWAPQMTFDRVNFMYLRKDEQLYETLPFNRYRKPVWLRPTLPPQVQDVSVHLNEAHGFALAAVKHVTLLPNRPKTGRQHYKIICQCSTYCGVSSDSVGDYFGCFLDAPEVTWYVDPGLTVTTLLPGLVKKMTLILVDDGPRGWVDEFKRSNPRVEIRIV